MRSAARSTRRAATVSRQCCSSTPTPRRSRSLCSTNPRATRCARSSPAPTSSPASSPSQSCRVPFDVPRHTTRSSRSKSCSPAPATCSRRLRCCLSITPVRPGAPGAGAAHARRDPRRGRRRGRADRWVRELRRAPGCRCPARRSPHLRSGRLRPILPSVPETTGGRLSPAPRLTRNRSSADPLSTSSRPCRPCRACHRRRHRSSRERPRRSPPW